MARVLLAISARGCVYPQTTARSEKLLTPSAPNSNSREVPPFAPGNPSESFIELLVETLQSVDRPVRGQFLQRFFKAMAHVDLPEALSLDYWDQILARRQELSENLGKPVALRTAIVDVLASTNFLRTPVLMEYEELKKLQVNAATDALTGLYNRRLFDEYFAKELNRAKRYSHHLALVLMDLHRFKEVNDRSGHLVGDQALQMAASTMRKTLRTSDYAFRIGGDEFALLLQQTDPGQAEILSRRLRSSYESTVQILKLDVPLALDYGVSICPEDGDTKEALVRIADERLYRLKHAARQSAVPVTAQRTVPVPEVSAVSPVHTPPEIAVPRVIPKVTSPVRETVVSAAGVPASAVAAVASAAAVMSARAERRKWERVSLAGTRAYAVVGDNPENTAKVIDLSYGGVALEMQRRADAPVNFNAILHVPILPPVRVSLQTTYVSPGEDAIARVGCVFLS
jgi:diguanylate cyclase (GGDEF)-like protein